MALRVKNIAAGFVDATGFHPIRRSPDYDADRAGDDYGARKDASGLKYSRKRKTRKAARRRTVHKKRSARSKRKTVARRSKNPISTQWVTAKVRKLGKDIQVMLFPRKRTARRRVRVVRRRRR